MAATAARPSTKGIPWDARIVAINGEFYTYPKNMIHPPDKIFGHIPARSLHFTTLQ
jgi:hypothetical protein